MDQVIAKRTKMARAEDYEVTIGTQAPLTTVWTEPASCVTAIPTISAGTCNTKSCSAYPPASVASLLYDSNNGASVNYPDFTTDQSQTSTNCMPSGYANLAMFYFTGGSQCPVSWATATVANGSTYKTIVCCPPAYPSPIYNSGGGDNYDCYNIMPLTAGQQFILHAKGDIASTRTASSESEFVPYWESESVIGTTQWPVATTAYVYHPGVNFLIQLPTSTSGSSSAGSSGGNSTSGNSSSFSVFALGLGGSIGALVGIAVVGLICLACLCTIFRRLLGGRRRRAPPSNVVYQAPGTLYAPPPPQAQYNTQPLPYQSKGPEIASHAV